MKYVHSRCGVDLCIWHVPVVLAVFAYWGVAVQKSGLHVYILYGSPLTCNTLQNALGVISAHDKLCIVCFKKCPANSEIAKL
jgi:hypothetical protein